MRLLVLIAFFLTINAHGEFFPVSVAGGQKSNLVKRDEGLSVVGPWIEFEMPGGASPHRIIKSKQFALFDGRLIGINLAPFNLFLYRSVDTANSTEMQSVEDVSLMLELDEIFGTGPMERPNAGSVNFLSLEGVSVSKNLEITIRSALGAKGVLTFGPGMKLLTVKVDDEDIPVFVQPSPCMPFRGTVVSLVRQVVQNDSDLKLWCRTFNQETSSTCVARAILPDHEVTWVGPAPAEWVTFGGTLYGLAASPDGGILVRQAIDSKIVTEGVVDRVLEKKDIPMLERRFFTSAVLPFRAFAERVSGHAVGNIYLDGVEVVGDQIDIKVSSPVIGKVSFSPRTQTGSVSIDGQLHVYTEGEIQTVLPQR